MVPLILVNPQIVWRRLRPGKWSRLLEWWRSRPGPRVFFSVANKGIYSGYMGMMEEKREITIV